MSQTDDGRPETGGTDDEVFGDRRAPAADRWGEYRAAATFTFDLDAEQLWRAAGRQEPGFERFSFRGTYGPEVGVPRILEVFERHDCRCTFFVPGRVAEERPATVQRIHEAGHEIAHHTYSHEHPRTMSAEREETEFKRTLDVIEDLTGDPPAGYRGGHAEQTVGLLAEAGMAYDASLMDTDLPYHVSDPPFAVSDIPYEQYDLDLVELPNAFLLDDFVYWGFNMDPCFGHQSGITPNGPVFDTWTAEFEGLRRRGRLFVPTMHPQVIGRASRIDGLDALVERAVEAEDTWVATCREVAAHWNERRAD